MKVSLEIIPKVEGRKKCVLKLVLLSACTNYRPVIGNHLYSEHDRKPFCHL